MFDFEELKLIQKKAREKFKTDYEQKNKKLLEKIERDLKESIERSDDYFELDINNYKEFKKDEKNLVNLQKYLEIKGFDTYCPKDINLINVYINDKI